MSEAGNKLLVSSEDFCCKWLSGTHF